MATEMKQGQRPGEQPLYGQRREQEFEEKIETYGPRLSRFCFSLCKSRQDAEDLYQETWLKAWQGYGQYDGSRPFHIWLERICVNAYRDSLRRAKARVPLVVFDTAEHMDAFFASVPDMPEAERDAYTRLYGAIANLPERERMAITVFYFDNIDGRTAAHILGVSEANFRVILHRARKQLEKELSV